MAPDPVKTTGFIDNVKKDGFQLSPFKAT